MVAEQDDHNSNVNRLHAVSSITEAEEVNTQEEHNLASHSTLDLSSPIIVLIIVLGRITGDRD